jgi:hypothetical protein
MRDVTPDLRAYIAKLREERRNLLTMTTATLYTRGQVATLREIISELDWIVEKGNEV